MKEKLNILPYENEDRYEDDNVFVDDVTIKYCQSTDCSGDDGEETVQELTVSSRNNGVARFINIKTDSWSISDIEELNEIIEDFKNRALLK